MTGFTNPITSNLLGQSALLGEIVTWEIVGVLATQTGVRAALIECGLDPELSRDLAPRNAFIRGMRDLQENRIIRKVSEDQFYLNFQFTKEANLGGKLDYLYECVLSFEKQVGTVTCPDKPELATSAKAALDAAMEVRRSKDITNIVQRIFSKNADLFPIRAQGGAYFVPAAHVLTIEKVEMFVEKLGGAFRRFPVPTGYQTGIKAVKESVADALSATLTEYSRAIDDFNPAETSARVMTTMAQRVKQTRMKIEGYAAYLQDEATTVLAHADEVKQQLAEKMGLPAGNGVAADAPALVETAEAAAPAGPKELPASVSVKAL